MPYPKILITKGNFHTLNQVNKLWIPYIIFRNTDSDEAVNLDGELRTLVAVKREGGFIRSGPEVADEASIMTN